MFGIFPNPRANTPLRTILHHQQITSPWLANSKYTPNKAHDWSYTVTWQALSFHTSVKRKIRVMLISKTHGNYYWKSFRIESLSKFHLFKPQMSWVISIFVMRIWMRNNNYSTLQSIMGFVDIFYKCGCIELILLVIYCLSKLMHIYSWATMQ